MILTCENCQTRYLLPTHALGGDGRRVRCTNCGHEWFQEPDNMADALPPDDLEPVLDEIPPIPEDSGLPALFEHLPEPPPKAPSDGRMAGYAVAAAAFLAVAGILFGLRGTIVEVWPPAWALYDLAHVAPPVKGEGLILNELAAVALMDEQGASVLNIRGSIVNLNDRTAPLPALQAVLLRGDDSPFDSWRIPLSDASVGPHGELAFKSVYSALPDDVQKVTIRLLNE